MNDSTGRSIGEKVGKSLDVETDEDGSAVGSFLRIKALVDVRKPLFRGVMVEDGVGEQSCWCNFRYEFLPNFCYSCGLLGHVEKECDEKVWNVHDHQFGDWMRASPVRKRDQRSRWSGGSSSGGSHQHKSSGSWRRGEMGRRLQQSEGGSRGKVLEDNELRDDGSTPPNSIPTITAAVKNAPVSPFSAPKTLTLDGAVKSSTGHLPSPALFDRFPSLEELSVAGARLSSLVGFPRLPALRRLSLPDNCLSGADSLAAVAESCGGTLRHLDLGNNRFAEVEELAPLQVEALVLYQCPVTKVKGYRENVFALIPSLKYLDGADAEGNERLEIDEEEDGEEEGEGEGEEEDGEGAEGDEEDGEDGEGDEEEEGKDDCWTLCHKFLTNISA